MQKCETCEQLIQSIVCPKHGRQFSPTCSYCDLCEHGKNVNQDCRECHAGESTEWITNPPTLTADEVSQLTEELGKRPFILRQPVRGTPHPTVRNFHGPTSISLWQVLLMDYERLLEAAGEKG